MPAEFDQLLAAFDAQLPQGTDPLQAVQEWLQREIVRLLQTDIEKLRLILYRIDIDEPDFRKLASLNQADLQVAAGNLADKIIQRQIQKANSRKQTGESADWDFDI
ncbi:MAG: hypothetical protein U0T84_05810 [Chitinophagales bacterium]